MEILKKIKINFIKKECSNINHIYLQIKNTAAISIAYNKVCYILCVILLSPLNLKSCHGGNSSLDHKPVYVQRSIESTKLHAVDMEQHKKLKN